MADLRCPDCGAEITVNLVYTAVFSEHRDLDGFECDDWACGAEWDKRGVQTKPSKKEARET